MVLNCGTSMSMEWWLLVGTLVGGSFLLLGSLPEKGAGGSKANDHEWHVSFYAKIRLM